MKKLTIKDLVGFRAKSDRSKKTFAQNLKSGREKENVDGGGDYWICCLSAISNSYKLGNVECISDKIDELEEKYKITDYKRTKTMYKRNLDILNSFEEFEMDRLRPSKEIKILKQHKWDQIIPIKGLPIKVSPNYVFTYNKDDVEYIGAIWFIAQLNGFKSGELGMFSEMIYRYLKSHYSKNYTIDPEYCIAVDVFNCHDVNYSQLQNQEIPKLLIPTVNEINKLV